MPVAVGGRTGAFAFVPPDAVDGRPHLVVDGAPRPGTVATVSHWPGTPTPSWLRADLSTESALLARRHRRRLAHALGPDAVGPDGVMVVTVDHADEDASAAVALLTDDELARRHADLLVEVARVGDFGVVRDRRAALVAFAVGTVLDPVRTPVAAVREGAVQGLAATGAVVGAAVDLLPSLVVEVDAHRHLWAAEAASYDASVAAVAAGRVVVTEEPQRDLAVVRSGPGGWPPAAAWGGEPVHPAAVHSATTCLRVATVDGDGVSVRYRYETWVRLRRRPRMLRVDLTLLADQLDALEAATVGPGERRGHWRFDGAGALTPRLGWDGERRSVLDPETVLDRLRTFLDRRTSDPPAWDPYR